MSRKSLALFFLIVGVCFSFVSCNDSVINNGNQSEEVGYLSIIVPNNSRGITGNEAVDIANFYEVFAWNEAGVIYAGNTAASSSNTTTVTLPPGEYKMVAFGGFQREGVSTSYHGLGSAYADGIIIQGGQTTEVSVALKPFEINVEIEDTEFKVQEEIPIKLSLNLNNDHIAISCLRATIYKQVGQGDNNPISWHSMLMYSATPDSVTDGTAVYTFNCTAPSTAGTYYVYFSTDGICLHDPDLPKYSNSMPASFYPALFNGTGGTMAPALRIENGVTLPNVYIRDLTVSDYPSFLAVSISWDV